ncbi:MAG TPA: DUF58 domain-containing protein [Rhodanobacteraceae bacterium]
MHAATLPIISHLAGSESRVPSPESRTDGITRVDLSELIALRARAGKPVAHAIRARDATAGGHVSALRGRGMDYAESRVYQAGDDARNIDWRRTARSGKWHTKLFQVEREHSVLLLIDMHATLRFGTRVRYKSVAAARAAAWLAWTSVRGGDRVGAMAFGAVHAALDPQGGTRGALAAIGALARWDAQAAQHGGADGEPLSAALERARHLAAPGTRIWLLSDGWCVDAMAASALARLKRRADVGVVLVIDPLERNLAPPGSYFFQTPSAKRQVNLASAIARAQLRDELAQGWRGLATACDAASIPRAALATTDEPDIVLAALWRRRSTGRNP